MAIGARAARLAKFKIGGWSLSLRLGSWLKAQLSFRALSVVPVFTMGGGIAFRAKLTLVRETAFHGHGSGVGLFLSDAVCVT